MNRTIITFVAVAIVGFVGGYLYMSSSQQPEAITQNNNPQNATYSIAGELVTLVGGAAEQAVAPRSATKVITRYSGNEIAVDLNDDGREDVAFLLTQNTGGSGTFFYVVAALNTEAGWVGSQGLFLGDRITPQTTQLSQTPVHRNVIVVNYRDRSDGQARLEQPSVDTSIWLKFDPQTLQFKELAQNFAEETRPEPTQLVVYLQNKSEVLLNDCGVVYARTIQVPSTTAVADASLRYLFNSELAQYGEYQSVVIVDGVAQVTVTNSDDPDGLRLSGLSSCESGHLMAVLDATLTQYESVTSIALYAPKGKIEF